MERIAADTLGKNVSTRISAPQNRPALSCGHGIFSEPVRLRNFRDERCQNQGYKNLFILRVLGYFANMKLLVLILVLALSAQPLQAGSCDMSMEKGQETSHHMGHSGQEQAENQVHDCCGSSGADSSDGCDGNMDCGPCFVSFTAIPSLVRFAPVFIHQQTPNLSSGVVLPSHASPPFRPPIS